MLSGMARVERARLQLLNGVAASGLNNGKAVKAAAFWGCLALRLALIQDSSFDTMATDSVAIYVNPEFADSLSEPELLGVVAHEVAHCALNHMGRRGNRDPELWNVACDLEINPLLLEHGFTLPQGALFEARFVGMACEQIYTVLEHERQQAKKQAQPQPQQGQQGQGQQPQPQQGPGQQQAPQQGQQGQQQAPGQQPGQSQPGQGQPGQQPGQPQQGQGQAGQPGQGQPQPGPGQGQQGPGQPGAGNAPGQPGQGPQQAGQGQQGQPGQPGQPGQGQPQPGQPGNGKPGAARDRGRCGGVLDAPKGQESALATDWKAAAIQAAAITARAEGAGMGEGSTARIVRELRRGRVNWQTVLQDIVTDSCITDDSWNTPNRRFIGSGLYLPGQLSDSRAHVVIGFDTSGSVTDKAVSRFKGEMQKMLDDGLAERFTVVFCDTRVRKVKTFQPGQKIDLSAPGGGGTDFRPVFEWLRKNRSDVACLVFFTDMDCPDSRFGTDPGLPVIWANWAAPRKAPFGKVIQIDPHN